MATAEQLEQLKRFDPVVFKIAGSIVRRLPRNIQRDDLIAAGRRGLWDAISRGRAFDELFESYARIRIRGAIMDELRAQDWLPRRARMRAEHDATQAPVVIRFEDLAVEWEPSESGDTAEAIDREHKHAQVAVLLFKLPPRERHVLGCYYLDGLLMREIAKEMGISQARASQLHARGLNRLRALLTGQQPAHCKAGKPRAR